MLPPSPYLFGTTIFNLLLVPEKQASSQLKTDEVGTIDQYFRAQYAYFPTAGSKEWHRVC